MDFTKVDGGNKKHKVRVYALSTCGWCRQLKQFLNERSIAYEYVDVDLCSRDDKKKITAFLKEHGLPLTFPLTVVDESKFISGYRLKEILKALQLK